MSTASVKLFLLLSAVVPAFIVGFAAHAQAIPVPSPEGLSGWQQALMRVQVGTQAQGKIMMASATLGPPPRVGGVADHRSPRNVRDHRSKNVRDHRACAPYCAWTNPGSPPPLGPSSWPSGPVQ